MEVVELTSRLLLVRCSDFVESAEALGNLHQDFNRGMLWVLQRQCSSLPATLLDLSNSQIEVFDLPSDVSLAPNLSLLSELLRSVSYWLNLDRVENAAIIYLPDSSASTLICVLGLLLGLDICGDSAEAWRFLEDKLHAGLHLFEIADLCEWPSSFRRCLSNFQKILAAPIPVPNLYIKNIFISGVSERPEVLLLASGGGGRISVETMDDSHRPSSSSSSLDDCELFDLQSSGGNYVLDFSKGGSQRITVQGDLCIELSDCYRFTFNTAFMAGDILVVKPSEWDGHVPPSLRLTIVSQHVSKRPVEIDTNEFRFVSIPNEYSCSSDSGAFLDHHCVGIDAEICSDLQAQGFSENSCKIAVKLSSGRFLDALIYLHRYFVLEAGGVGGFSPFGFGSIGGMGSADLGSAMSFTVFDDSVADSASFVSEGFNGELTHQRKPPQLEIGKLDVTNVEQISKPPFPKGKAPPLPGQRPAIDSTAGAHVPGPGTTGIGTTGIGATAPPVPPVARAPPLPPGRASPPPPPSKAMPPPKKFPTEPEPPRPQGFLPLGRKFHWKPLNDRAIANTVWESLGEVETANFEELPEVFGKAGTSNGVNSVAEVNANSVSAEQAIANLVTLIDPKRAQNVGVVLARLPVDTLLPRLCSLSSEGLNLEMLERLRSILPSEDEVQAFANCPEDANLRDIERKLRPIFLVKRLPQRIRVLTVQLQLDSLTNHTHGELTVLRKASEEVRESKKLRRLLSLVLQLGNYLNFGTSELLIKGFSLDTLQKLLEFRSSSDSAVSTLHFLAARAVDSERDLVSVSIEMPSLGLACKVGIDSIQSALTCLKADGLAIAQELQAGKGSSLYDEQALVRLETLNLMVNEKQSKLADEWSVVESKLFDVRKFFGEDPKKCAPEDFFAAIKSFLDAFTAACVDLQRHPKKLHKILHKSK